MEPLSCCSFQGSAAGMPPKRPTRYTRASKKAATSPSQLPSELPTTLSPTQLALPLPLKQPTPTPSDVDVDMLVGGGEYALADSAQHLMVCSPFGKLNPPADDIRFIQHPAQPTITAPTGMELDLKPISSCDLEDLVSLDEPQPIAPISPIHSAGEYLNSPKSVISISGMYSSYRLLSEELTLHVDSEPAVPPESEVTQPLTLTPGMEIEVADWLKSVGSDWAQRQEEKHGVPSDVWLSHIHRLTKPYKKLSGAFNSWNCFQKWWKHHHQEEERPIIADDGKSSII